MNIPTILGGIVVISGLTVLSIYAMIGIECVHANGCIGANRYSSDVISKINRYKCSNCGKWDCPK